MSNRRLSITTETNPFTNHADSDGNDDSSVEKHIKALENKKMMALLTAHFNKATDRKLAPIEGISKMKEENEYRDDRMENTERKIDEYEQWDRENNIITGLKNSEVDKDEMSKKLNNKLGTRINADNIKYVYKLKTTQTNNPTGVTVAFNDDQTKKEVMKARVYCMCIKPL